MWGHSGWAEVHGGQGGVQQACGGQSGGGVCGARVRGQGHIWARVGAGGTWGQSGGGNEGACRGQSLGHGLWNMGARVGGGAC